MYPILIAEMSGSFCGCSALVPMRMISFGTLPPEIWLIIVDMAVEASIIPDEICNYSNLARLNEYLRTPYGPPIDQSWANLRLVCQAFKALAGPAPRFSMDRKGVLESARDVYISVPSSVTSCMQQLVRHPSKNKVVALAIPSSHGKVDQDRITQNILRHGPSLPNLRKLTITLQGVNWSKAWGNLHDGFPSLTCLVIHGGIIPSYAVSFVVDKVVFQRLKMLALHCLVPFVGVEFPALRHLSLDRCSREEMKVITRWPHVESLLLRTMDRKTEFDWKHFPNLRLLGLPPTHLWVISRCPYDHPLSHLSLYTVPFPRSSYTFLVEPIMERRHSPTKIILNLETITEQRLDMIAHGCASAGLQLVGSPYGFTRRSALFIAGMVPPSVIDRVTYAAGAVGKILGLPAFMLFCFIFGSPFE